MTEGAKIAPTAQVENIPPERLQVQSPISRGAFRVPERGNFAEPGQAAPYMLEQAKANRDSGAERRRGECAGKAESSF